MDVLLATSNPHKIEELRALLALSGWRLRRTDEFPSRTEPEESGTTYEDNALLKARFWSRETGLPALADDSGLEVDALDGRPGVQSARYAPTSPERIARLLEELGQTPPERRAARFVCAVALAGPDNSVVLCRGVCPGRIAFSPAGEHGFGYDPIFLVDGCDGRAMAQLTAAEKNTLSHRARAITALLHKLSAAG
jgi:XTP/dITP diphosphohydrolase